MTRPTVSAVPEAKTFTLGAGDLLRLMEFHQGKKDTRRTYEWRVAFGIWAALGAYSGFVLSAAASPIPRLSEDGLPGVVIVLLLMVFVTVLLLIAVVSHFFFLNGLIRANEVDGRRADFYAFILEEGIPPDVRVHTECRDREIKRLREECSRALKNWEKGLSGGVSLTKWSTMPQILFTTCLFILATLATYFRLLG